MKRIFTLLSLFLCSLSVNASSGIFDDAIKVQKNGGTATEYYFGTRCTNMAGGCVGSNGSTSADFQGASLGTGVLSLKITFVEVRTFKNSGDDITGANLFYRVYKTGDNPSYTNESIAFGANIGMGGDQRWTETLNIELTNGLLPNTSYTVEIYSTANFTFTGGGGGSGTHTNNNGGANFKLTFTSDATLSVGMGRFAALMKNSTSVLDWTTVSEKNAAHFDIQRSNDNAAWSNIGQVKAVNNAYGADYQFVDAQPLSGTNYYRLQMVDANGSTELSKIVALNASNGSKSLRIYPNPAKDVLTILTDANTEGVSIFDINGRLALSVVDKSQNVNIQNLASGVYFVRMMDKTGFVGSPVRFVKQ